MLSTAFVWIARTLIPVIIASGLFFAHFVSPINFHEIIILNSDKVEHYFYSSFLMVVSLTAFPKAKIYPVFLGVIGIAASIEILQTLTPRSADPVDFVAGLAGAASIALTQCVFRLRNSMLLVENS